MDDYGDVFQEPTMRICILKHAITRYLYHQLKIRKECALRCAGSLTYDDSVGATCVFHGVGSYVFEN